MNEKIDKITSGQIVNENQKITIEVLCETCSLTVEQIKTMVEYGIIEPIQYKSDTSQWIFKAKCVIRVKTVVRLQRDLGVNMSGAALAIELLEEIRRLRQIKDMADI